MSWGLLGTPLVPEKAFDGHRLPEVCLENPALVPW